MTAKQQLRQNRPVFSGVCSLAVCASFLLALHGCAATPGTYGGSTGGERAGISAGAEQGDSRIHAVFAANGKLWITRLTTTGDPLHESVDIGPVTGRLFPAPLRKRTVRVLTPAARKAVAVARADGEPVELRGPQLWQTLLEMSLRELTPDGEGTGAVVDILGEDEIFLYRTSEDGVLAVPIIYRPAGITVGASFTFDELLHVMRKRLPVDFPASVRLLFETGDNSEFGYPLVFVNSETGDILFLQSKSDGGTSGNGQLGTTLEVFMHALVDHVRALFNQPVSSVSRLFTMVSTTAADFAHPTPFAMLEHKPVPDACPIWSTARSSFPVSTNRWFGGKVRRHARLHL